MNKWEVEAPNDWEIVTAQKIIIDKYSGALLFLSEGELVRSFSPIGWLNVRLYDRGGNEDDE